MMIVIKNGGHESCHYLNVMQDFHKNHREAINSRLFGSFPVIKNTNIKPNEAFLFDRHNLNMFKCDRDDIINDKYNSIDLNRKTMMMNHAMFDSVVKMDNLS